MTIPDGTVLNGCFWLNDETWLILNQNIPLKDFLTAQLQEQRQYIGRLTARADTLEKWLKENPK